jgi:hypothetical protein
MIFKRMQDYFFTVWQITLTEYLKLTIIMPEETAGMVVIRARGIYHSMGLIHPGGYKNRYNLKKFYNIR